MCKICAHHPGRTCEREWDLPERRRAHYDAAPRSRPIAEGALSTSERAAQTSGWTQQRRVSLCKGTRAQVGKVCVFTSVQDSSWVWERRSESPLISQWTCSCCSAPSGQSAPITQCCIALGSRPQWSLAFGIHTMRGQEGRTCVTMSGGQGQMVTGSNSIETLG